MKKYIVLFTLSLAILWSCETPEDFSGTYTGDGIQLVIATFADGSGAFYSEGEAPYGDTVKIVIPYYYPEESDNVTDISQMRVSANLPNNVMLTPALGVVDLREPIDVTVMAANGETRKHVIAGDIRRSSKAQILEFSLPEKQMKGFVIEENRLVGLVSGGINLSNLKPSIVVSPHATVSPDPSIPQNFNNPVVYTVTADDGTKVGYTVQIITPNKITKGFRPESMKLMWQKTLVDLGVYVQYNNFSLGVTDDYLLVQSRSKEVKYYDRFTAEYGGNLNLGALGTSLYALTTDNSGHILACNQVQPNAKFMIFRWNGVTDTPVKYLEWTNDQAKDVGRRISVSGDLDGDALIYAFVAASNVILRWQVSGGQLVSQTPSAIPYGSAQAWNFTADFASEGTRPTDNFFFSGWKPAAVSYIDAANIAPIATADVSGYQVTHALDYIRFNNAGYLAATDIITYNGRCFIYDVSSPSLLATPQSDPNYSSIRVFTSPKSPGSNNVSAGGDVLFKASKDGYKLVLYFLVSNGSVAAYEFDCIDLENIF